MFTDAASHLDDLAQFVLDSPTSFHAARTVASRLTTAGFTQVDEKGAFPGGAGRFFVVRGGAVIAWRQPERIDGGTGLRVVGAHTDSPAFKVKPDVDFTVRGWRQLAVEIYGGMLINSWLDRDLGIAGRLVTRDGATHLVRLPGVARVPQLAIHLDRAVNDGLKLDRQAHTQPVVGLEVGAGVLAALAEQAGVRAEEVIGHDLFTFDSQAPARLGLGGELFASGRLDNLSSTHAELTAFEGLGDGDDLVVFATFDHEEIGSETSTGAAGPFLADVLERIAAVAGLGVDGFKALMVRGSCISADAGHLVHPNHQQHHDPRADLRPNAGPMLKVNANQRYATDAHGAALWRLACEREGVPNQTFVSNNAMPCGSTIGPITATRLGLATVDVGIGLLSMHSARELCGAEDPYHLSRALRSYLEG
ncbi:MAG: M18 family aminopeptidase [Propionibacteriaceae bacterium]|nr:M18 family aminopeptidase [Propionibacteriaceae bacterium]